MVKEVGRSHIVDDLVGKDFAFHLTYLESTGNLLPSGDIVIRDFYEVPPSCYSVDNGLEIGNKGNGGDVG